jgi:hypothetical protein
MLNLDILSRNKNIFNPDSQDQERNYGIWDLTRSSVSFKNTKVEFKKYVVVKEDYQMRPDIIAYKVYGDLKFTGSLMKINSISNPFALTLFIPQLNINIVYHFYVILLHLILICKKEYSRSAMHLHDLNLCFFRQYVSAE